MEKDQKGADSVTVRLFSSPVDGRCINWDCENSAINAIRKLIDSLEKDDLHILTRVKAFANDIYTTSPEMTGAAKNIAHIVKRVVCPSKALATVFILICYYSTGGGWPRWRA